MTAPAFKRPTDPVRNAELGLIHAAKKQLALSDDSYRGLIGRFSRGRSESSADLTAAERREVIEYFRSIGFAKVGKPKSAADRRADYRPQASKIKALWHSLYQLGHVRNESQEACDAFVRRHTGIETMRWNHPEHLELAIECLKRWAARK